MKEEKSVKTAEEAGWHLSEYLISKKKSNEKVAIINLLKRSYIELPYTHFKALCFLNKIKEDNPILKFFISNNLIVNFNEKEYVKSSLLLNYNKRNKLTILIAPTLACNFNCPYCFEKHNDKTKMSLEIQNKVIDFIKKTLKLSGKKNLDIVWYGGEPLLCPEIIEYISNSLISFCNEEKIIYSSGILTNGYFFNQKNVEVLNKSKVNRAQITLDGLEKNHDLTRHLINGEGSFKQIINNLNSVNFNGIINIRIDIYNKNKQDIEELKKIFEEIQNNTKNKINYYVAPIVNNPAEKRNDQVDFLNIQDTIDFELQRRKKTLPRFKTTYCAASSLFFFGIDNKGRLYKCWEDFGAEERSYGNIEEWNIKNPLKTAKNLNILTQYINSSGIFDSECYNCVWLPICAGGCPSKRFFCNMKCLPYVPYKYDLNFFIDKISSYVNNE